MSTEPHTDWRDALDYVDRHPAVVAAQENVSIIGQKMVSSNRWGECRRFSGRGAGLRIERLDRAIARLGRARDKARKEFEHGQR
ncbi:MAG: hypothetical protein AAB229_05445 [Candidatus Hydrogenedentota bacterium]